VTGESREIAVEEAAGGLDEGDAADTAAATGVEEWIYAPEERTGAL